MGVQCSSGEGDKPGWRQRELSTASVSAEASSTQILPAHTTWFQSVDGFSLYCCAPLCTMHSPCRPVARSKQEHVCVFAHGLTKKTARGALCVCTLLRNTLMTRPRVMPATGKRSTMMCRSSSFRKGSRDRPHGKRRGARWLTRRCCLFVD
jgi:hypothetical protein